MTLSTSNLLPGDYSSPEQTPHPFPMSLTVRDHNIIRPPQRTSSLKSPSPELKIFKQPKQSSKVDYGNHAKPPDKLASHSPRSLLQVTKTRSLTRLNWKGEKEQVARGQALQMSANGLHSMEPSGSYVYSCENARPSAPRGDSRVSKFAQRRARDGEMILTHSSESIPSSDSYISHISTTTSDLTMASTGSQPHQRRHSVKGAVTKAFATLNRRKRFSQTSDSNDLKPFQLDDFSSTSPPSTCSSRKMGNHCKPQHFDIQGANASMLSRSDFQEADDYDVPANQPITSGRENRGEDPISRDHQTQRPYTSPMNLGNGGQGGNPPVAPASLRPASVSGGSISGSLYSNDNEPKGSILRVRLEAKSELRRARLTSEESIWAVVQIHGEVQHSIMPHPSTETGIAVAIVLDNSCLSTQKDVEKACLEVLNLAAHLQKHDDRLGIFCTAFGNPEDGVEEPNCCLVHPFDQLDMNSLGSKLKNVPKQGQQGNYLRAAFRQAIQALQIFDRVPDHKAPKLRQDIILISPNPIGLPACLEEISPAFRIHLFNPGLVPFVNIDAFNRRNIDDLTQKSEPRNGHWLQHSNVGSLMWVLDAARCISGDCKFHQSHSLEDIVIHSKSRANAGIIRDVSVSIESGPDAVVEVVDGTLDFSALLPGQMISLLVKVKLKSLSPRLSYQERPASREYSQHSISSAISELELTLGEHLSELFRVQVRYSHSFFPDNTRLVIEESCWLRRTLTPRRSIYSGEIQGDDDCGHSRFNCLVQKQLAICLATTPVPLNALQRLETEFSSKLVPGSCSKFVEAVKRRLRHRSSQFSTCISVESARNTENMPFWYSMAALSPSYELEPYEIELREITEEQERVRRSSPDSPATVIRRRPVQTSEAETSHEEAQKIWRHIRKTSKPEREILEDSEAGRSTLDKADPQIEEIRRTALRNNRKMSTETLRSLAMDMRRVSGHLEDVHELDDEVD